jgi:hypothetical protein
MDSIPEPGLKIKEIVAGIYIVEDNWSLGDDFFRQSSLYLKSDSPAKMPRKSVFKSLSKGDTHYGHPALVTPPRKTEADETP